jgi:hypothetical protein
MNYKLIVLGIITTVFFSCHDNSYENWKQTDNKKLGISLKYPSGYSISNEDDKIDLFPPNSNWSKIGVNRYYSTERTIQDFYQEHMNDKGFIHFKKDSIEISNSVLYLIEKVREDSLSNNMTYGLLKTKYYDFMFYNFEKSDSIFRKLLKTVSVNYSSLDSSYKYRKKDLVVADFGEVDIEFLLGENCFRQESDNKYRVLMPIRKELFEEIKYDIRVRLLGGSVETLNIDSLLYNSTVRTKRDTIKLLVTLNQTENRVLTIKEFLIPLNNN